MSDTKLLQAILHIVEAVDKKVDKVKNVVVKNGKRLAKLQDDEPAI